jgi:glycosyltransferase involved in cell wall biosynthesis
MADASDNPLVTVVCSTFNSKATLRCALRSVLNQEFTDFEVRVMGDCCTDGSEQIVAGLNDSRVHWYNFPKNSGTQSEPNNEGMRRARGKYVALLPHDDLWMPWHLSRLVGYIETTGADFVHDLVVNIAPEGVYGAYGPPHPRSDYTRSFVPVCSWLYRRSLPEGLIYWRNANDLGWGIDFDVTRRLALAGKEIRFLHSLGAFKFHSMIWKFYSATGTPPQEKLLADLMNDPHAVTENILTQLGAQFAQEYQWHDRKSPLPVALNRWKDASKDVLKAAVRDLIYSYGAERWPVAKITARRLRRLRSKQRVARGLRSLEERGL